MENLGNNNSQYLSKVVYGVLVTLEGVETGIDSGTTSSFPMPDPMRKKLFKFIRK